MWGGAPPRIPDSTSAWRSGGPGPPVQAGQALALGTFPQRMPGHPGWWPPGRVHCRPRTLRRRDPVEATGSRVAGPPPAAAAPAEVSPKKADRSEDWNKGKEAMMKSARVVMWTEGETGPRFPLDEQGIAQAGGVVRRVACRNEAERIAAAGDAYALIVAHAQITEALFAGAPGVVGLVRTGIGLDSVDLPAATRHGVCVAHVPDFCYDEVADTTMTLLLAVARKVLLADRHVRGGSWTLSALLPLRRPLGQIMGLVGFGHIARAVAERARGFGLRLIAFDPYVDASTMEGRGVEKVDLNTLLARADIVSCHAPLTQETRGLLGPKEFSAIKPGAILINTS